MTTIMPPVVAHKMRKETAKPFAFWRINSFIPFPASAPQIKDIFILILCRRGAAEWSLS